MYSSGRNPSHVKTGCRIIIWILCGLHHVQQMIWTLNKHFSCCDHLCRIVSLSHPLIIHSWKAGQQQWHQQRPIPKLWAGWRAWIEMNAIAFCLIGMRVVRRSHDYVCVCLIYFSLYFEIHNTKLGRSIDKYLIYVEAPWNGHEFSPIFIHTHLI